MIDDRNKSGNGLSKKCKKHRIILSHDKRFKDYLYNLKDKRNLI